MEGCHKMSREVENEDEKEKEVEDACVVFFIEKRL